MIVSFLRTITVLDDSHDVIISTVIPAACLVLIWIPASLPREITALRYGSTCCIIGMLYIIVVLIAQAPAYMARQDFSEVEYIKLDRNIFSVIGICLFSYCGGQNIPSIYNELLLRSPSRIKKVILRGMATIILFYCLMALIGYLTTLHDTPELIVFRPPISGSKDEDWPMVLARLTVIIYLNMNLPMNLYPTRMCLERILFNTQPPNMILHCLLTTIILTSNLLIALLLPDALFFFRIVGSFGAMAICITIPAMLYYKISRNRCEKAVVIIGCACVWVLGCSCIVDTVLTAV
jgi:amino acid permease